MKRSLLLGCGSRDTRFIHPPGTEEEGWGELVRLDCNPSHKPDVLWNLEWPEPLPFPDDYFDELAAFEVLEHIGPQGDAATLLRQFSDYWRVLRPDGYFCATVPWWDDQWAWGDPSHRRVITPGTLAFLSQREYKKQVGVTAMSDFRGIYKADFEIIAITPRTNEVCGFVLQAIKPSRWECPANA